MEECLPSVGKVLGSKPSTVKKKKSPMVAEFLGWAGPLLGSLGDLCSGSKLPEEERMVNVGCCGSRESGGFLEESGSSQVSKVENQAGHGGSRL